MTVADAPPAAASPEGLHALLREILPPQGAWSDEEYLWLTDRCRRLVEFTDGHVEELPMPTFTHQAILALLHRLFHAHVAPRGGVVLFAALRLRVREGKFREPDLLLLRDRSDARGRDRYWLGADLVAEVVSRTTRPGIWSSSAPTTPRRAFRSTGSSTPATKRSPCSRWKGTNTSNTAYSQPATRRPRRCSLDSPST